MTLVMMTVMVVKMSVFQIVGYPASIVCFMSMASSVVD
jgi:hypothetical protein